MEPKISYNLPRSAPATPIALPTFRVEPDWEQKLDILGNGAADDLACQSCAANPNAGVVTHRAHQPIAAKDKVRPKDLRPWLSDATRSDGKRIKLVKTLMTSACEKDCYYCATRRGRNRLRRETFKPEELAKGFNIIHRRGIADGIFLSSGVIGGGTRTMEKTIAAIEILRRKYEYRGYVHLKLMPGAETAAVERALQLADRVSVNLEAPNSERLAKLTGTKIFTEELMAPMRDARMLMKKYPHLARVSMTTQLIVGAAGESDREIVTTATQVYRELELGRIYYSAFHPIIDTPLENHAPTDPLREFRLYQTDFLLRQYGFTYEELIFDNNGNLPLQHDPKTAWALHHPEHFPLEINRATREELLRVPGLGPTSVNRILQLRHNHKLNTIQELKQLGADTQRALPFILLNGKHPTHQLPLFSA
ncbi:MAG TPA: radical SAM protein [Anaerolineae bacterium]|nr:radical SAM protein [Anaerolineae bacterium]